MSADYDEWGLSSGLPLADAEVTVEAMEFGFNNAIAAGTIFANFTFIDADGERHEQSFSVGKDWEPADKGAELVSTTGKPRKLSQNSNYGLLVKSAIEAVQGDLSKLGKGFRFAETWIGSQWRTGTVERDVENQNTGEKSKKDRIIFVEFLGNEGASPAPAGKKAKAAKAEAADDNGVEPELWAALVKLATDADDHDSFMDEALELEGVVGVKAVEKLVMGTKPGSVWASAGK